MGQNSFYVKNCFVKIRWVKIVGDLLWRLQQEETLFWANKQSCHSWMRLVSATLRTMYQKSIFYV